MECFNAAFKCLFASWCVCMQLFENAVYIFSAQPFHPSDVLIIDGTRYTVMRMTLLTVVLRRGDGAVVTVATSAIRAKQVHNVTRSDRLREELQFSIPRGTPQDKLEGIAHYVKTCVQQHRKLFRGTYEIWPSPSAGDTVQLSIAFDHSTNGVVPAQLS